MGRLSWRHHGSAGWRKTIAGNFVRPMFVHLTYILICTMFSPSPLTEGVSGDVPLAERGRRRLQAGFVTSSQEARSLSVPDEGAAFNGWTRADEGRRQCRMDHVWVCPSGPL